ncbi:tumor necrosis factor receptor superfamily member 18 [Garra rufa]|uniref:tumor necrosis factor receptor superfamily member 18 n=1 Tax=Garra rufa TaxID=137080 RepID=UPI003CCEC32E
MDTAKLWFTLLCVCSSWILCLAIQCDWRTEYEYGNRCCKACPSGEYPKVPCPKSGDSVCQKCSTAVSPSDKCFCKDNHLCFDDKCTTCNPRERCKPGHQLRRTGAYDYTFYCDPCEDNFYNDVEDSTCKPITKCVGGEIFPGNRTHNSRCASSVKFTTVPRGNQDEEKDTQATHPFMLACLAVAVLTFLVFIIYIVCQFVRYKMRTKISKAYTQRIVLPPDSCSCKLSKEEEGEEDDYKSEVSDVLCKHHLHSFP